MKKYPDTTQIVHMNLPGTHDVATWNYTQATQDALRSITEGINETPTLPPEFFRCQSSSIISMLNAGIRVFDLRYNFDATKSTIVFYHGQALQSQITTVEDLLLAYYFWLEAHPSETVLLSLKDERNTAKNASNNAALQMAIYNALNTAAAKHYISQKKDALPSLGDARGKVILLQRFDLPDLDPSYEASLPGLHFPPSLWTDNGASIDLTYNSKLDLAAHIEDLYIPGASAAEANIQIKYNATITNLLRAMNDEKTKDDLFWSFSSGGSTKNIPPETPEITALGNGTDTPSGGVNRMLLEFLSKYKGTGARMGIIMFDFYELPDGLVEAFLDV